MLDLSLFTQLPIQALSILSLLLFAAYRRQPVMNFLVGFHLLTSLLEAVWLDYLSATSTGTTVILWQYQALALSNIVKIMLLLVSISMSFSMLCHSTLLLLSGYGMLMALQFAGLSQLLLDSELEALIRNIYQVISQLVQIFLVLVLSYPSMKMLRERLE